MRFGSRSTGARNDFQQAWELARELVSSGLSPLGVVSSENLPTETFYNECKRIIDQAEQKTRSMLEENRDLLFRLADLLIQEENLDHQRFQEIVYSRHQLAV